jgi:hypothetical protein
MRVQSRSSRWVARFSAVRAARQAQRLVARVAATVSA